VRSSPVISTMPGLPDQPAELDQLPRALAPVHLPAAPVMPRPGCLMAVARGPVSFQRRRRRFHLPEADRRDLPRNIAAPRFAQASRFRRVRRLGQHDQRAGQFLGRERIGPGGDHQLAQLLHLARLELPRLVLERLQLRVEIPRFAHVVLLKSLMR
jgi:hypothetical protein